MAVPKKGWRRLTVNEHSYFWRAIGTDWGISVVVVTEDAFIPGATAQQLTFQLRYDALQTPHPDGSVSLKQRAAVAPGVVALAIQHAIRSTPRFTGKIGEQNIVLPAHVLPELQAAARMDVTQPS